MGQTTLKFGSPMAQKRWSGQLFLETIKKSYWDKFEGRSENSVIMVKNDLASDAGDRVSYDISVQLRGKPTSGDDRLKGNEEGLKFFTDEVIIDQLRKSVSAGGKMTRKRTSHDLRKVAKDRLSDYWAQYIDEMKFIYMSGSRGINEDFIEDESYTGHAKNPLRQPDSQHLMFGGAATSKATITAGDTMSRSLVEKCVVKCRMIKARDRNSANMVPIMVDGAKHFVMIMSPYQEHDMRQEAGEKGWLEVQKARAAAEGKANPIFVGGLGMINNCVLHSHESVIRYNDYGAGQNVNAARALFLGRQAAVIAYGSPGGMRFTWKEETDDFGNEPVVAAGTILGLTKVQFNNRDFGVISVDTAATDPNE